MAGSELIVFGNQELARRAGFVGPKFQRPDFPDIMAWWPSLGPERLRGREFSRITVNERVSRAHADLIRARLRVEPMLWIDLT